MTTWRRRFRGGATAVRSARSAVRERLGGELGQPQLADVELLVSELATNSVRHGANGGLVSLEAAVTDDWVRLRLCDPGTGFERPREPAPHADGSGGYGLVLLERLSDRWGVQRNGGFCVWFEIAR
jgi:anti-sigma regulatory factor (Ser/Thr protein kinase)